MAEELDNRVYDVVVVGSGIAGMTVALSLHPELKVALVSKEQSTESSTYKAQGGMSVAVGPDDSAEEHIADTLRVGRGLCREEAVEVMVRGGPDALTFLLSLGTKFNLKGKQLDLTKEAGHSRNRVVHYYDYTGRHIAETMDRETSGRQNIERLDNCFLVDILTQQEQCCGCVVACSGQLTILRANIVVIATGGYSGIFARSTNAAANGDGIAAAYRAGAAISDMEFVQFHPTTFTTAEGKILLLTEALRGEGAALCNAAGKRFMFSYHPDGELAPRDEVSRAITTEMQRDNQESVYLDARHLGKEYLADRFRYVYAELARNGYFMERDIIPIAPAAHYTIGGIGTDLWGQTTVTNLFACGEAAATGVHGANRLASNSLLEGVVFGRRVAGAINREFANGISTGPFVKIAANTQAEWQDSKLLGRELDRVAGVVRSEKELSLLLSWLHQGGGSQCAPAAGIQTQRAGNVYLLAQLLLEAALLRCESRGTHYRVDYPETNNVDFNKHIVQQMGRKAALHEQSGSRRLVAAGTNRGCRVR